MATTHATTDPTIPVFIIMQAEVVDSSTAGHERLNATIVQELNTRGWSISNGYFSAEEVAMLRAECRVRWDGGDFRHAGVGRGAELKIRPELRGDHVYWLDPTIPDTPQQQKYFRALERLRHAINGELFLGLFDYEAFFAVYPPGRFYKKHLDRFRGNTNRFAQDVAAQSNTAAGEIALPGGQRTVTCVLYLNDDWQASDGGALRLYLDAAGAGPWIDVLPCAGTLAVFITEGRWHEVLPANRERMSLTGFFRTRG